MVTTPRCTRCSLLFKRHLPSGSTDQASKFTIGGPTPRISPNLDTAPESCRKQAKQRSWQRYTAVLPDWFSTYVGMESEASVIRTYECQMVPGLLQTEEYARAAFQPAPPRHAHA
jgi:hypothetical protein